MAAIDPVRNAAVNVITRVARDNAYLTMALDAALRRTEMSERGRRFLTQLAYGTTRHRLLCDHIIRQRLHQPMEKLPPPILAVLRMGVFQALFCSQVTFPSMVHTSVDLAQKWGHSGTARLANAILRKVPTSVEAVDLPSRDKDPVGHLSIRYSIPDWLVAEWLQEHGEEGAESLCQASNTEAPVTLRANTLKTTAEQLVATMVKRGTTAAKMTTVPEEVTVAGGGPPVHSKLFGDGHFVVQDPASMLPAHLLQPEPGHRVLDLCAGLGMKSTHIAALTGNEAAVWASDMLPTKLGLLRDNCEHLGISRVHPLCANGLAAPFEQSFDRVLVDAPCSGLGTLRRHPDLKWRVKPEDRVNLARLQEGLLRSAAGLCKNGGIVVYSVCTFTREETVDVARAVLPTLNMELEDGPEWLTQWKIDRGQYRVLPKTGGLDGFFLMRLRKGS